MTFWAVGSAVAGPLISGMMAGDAASEGYEAQAAGAAKADATQRYIFDTNRADNADFLNNGRAGSNRLAYLMGLNPNGGGGGRSYLTREQLRNQLLGQYTTTTPGAKTEPVAKGGDSQAVGDVFGFSGGNIGFYNPNEVGQSTTQVNEAGLNAAIESAWADQEKARAAAEAGAANDPAYGSLLRKFSRGDLEGDVVYQNGLQFGLDEGRKGIERQQQASGGLLSGATLKALSRFGNDYGTTKTEGAYNRYTQDNTNIYNKLAGIAGSGQTAAAQVGTAGQNYATAVGNTAIGLGNARAASGIAGSNAMSGGIQGAFNNYQSGQMLRQIQGTPNYRTNYNIGSEPYDGYNASVGLG